MPGRIPPLNIDEYISAAPPKSQPILQQIRKTVREAAPQAEECMSYGMPALKQRSILVYFAAFKSHIGFYPPVRAGAKLLRDVKRYAGEKGSLRFPLDEPIPYALIRRIVKARLLATARQTNSK
jgi:uncharacterized protein YdhG (YjbR/CyaY superfamily)